ncbi:MAG TPA: 50S ribosomal protein L21 [Bacillota bacterium]|nr:50S ribosomal protein L21 [Bacillota bacterium]
MYAVVETGGKQYRVREGDVVEIELLGADAVPGAEITFERVLALGGEGTFRPGTPLVAGAKVTGRVLAEVRGKKLTVFRYKAKANERRKTGHRQNRTRVLVTGVAAGGEEAAQHGA